MRGIPVQGRGFLAGGAAVVACLLLAGRAGTACGDKDAPAEVQVSVVAILAAEGKSKVDPRVECIAKEVRKVRPELKYFRPAKMTCKPLTVGKADDFELVADQHATVTVLNASCKNGRVQLKVTPPTLGEITYTTACGKFFPIVTRYQTKNGEWLILAVRVEPCKGKKK